MILLLLIMNSYPVQAVRRLIISSKETELSSGVQTLASTLEDFTALSHENISVSVRVLDLSDDQRILVTDASGTVIYDNSKSSSLAGKILLLPEIVAALEGNNVFHCVYDDVAFISSAAVPVMKSTTAIGAVYVYDYDTEQAAFLSSTRSNILNLSIFLSVLVTVALLIFMVYFGKRISTLTDGIRDMSAGNYDSRITISGEDELAEMASEFNELADRLAKTEELRREFVSNASHELKTPLASIKLLSDSILQTKGISKNDVDEFLTDINEEIDRLTRITERLLQLTKLDFVPQSAVNRCDLTKLVQKIVEILRENAAMAKVTLNNRVDRQLWVYFDKDGLHQVVFNLIENAIKYNHTGGSVTVWAEKENRPAKEEKKDFVLLHVKDTGIGIPQEAIDHIFERFYRVDKARARATGGTGLGLSIVADWLHTLDGDIRVTSVLGEGTEFCVILPAAQEDLPEESGAQQ